MEHDKREEAINALLEWAEEDAVNRSVMIFACDEEHVRTAYNGNRRNLVGALAESMLNEELIRSVYAQALTAVRTVESKEQVNK